MKVKVIIIDSNSQTVREVFVDDNLDNDTTRLLLKAVYIDYGGEYNGEYLFKNLMDFEFNNNFFKLKNNSTKWIGGVGLISDVTIDGDQITLLGTNMDLDYVKDNLVWCQVDDDESKEVIQQKNRPIISFQFLDVNDFLDFFDNDL